MNRTHGESPTPYTRHGVTVAAVVGLTVTLSVAHARDDILGCGQYELMSTGEDREIVYVDAAPEGRSAGDMRIGSRVLRTLDGEPVGRLRFRVTDLDPSNNEERGIGHLKNFVIFPEGVLLYEHIYERTGKFDDLQSFTTSSGDRYVVSGIGAFAGAEGIIRVTKKEGVSEVYAFDIKCK